MTPVRRYALALWFAGLGLLAGVRGALALRDQPSGVPLAPHDLAWWLGAALCLSVAAWAAWRTRGADNRD